MTPTEEAASWDWTKGNAALSKIHRCRHTTVARIRAELGKPAISGTKIVHEIDWPNLDWRCGTEELAAKIGCSPSLVTARRKIHAPSTLSRQNGCGAGVVHPNYKSGHYVGEKAKVREPTPRTGCNAALRAWIKDNIAIGGKFLSTRACVALEEVGFPRKKTSSALGKLRKLGEITKVESWGGLAGDSVNTREK